VWRFQLTIPTIVISWKSRDTFLAIYFEAILFGNQKPRNTAKSKYSVSTTERARCTVLYEKKWLRRLVIAVATGGAHKKLPDLSADPEVHP